MAEDTYIARRQPQPANDMVKIMIRHGKNVVYVRYPCFYGASPLLHAVVKSWKSLKTHLIRMTTIVRADGARCYRETGSSPSDTPTSMSSKQKGLPRNGDLSLTSRIPQSTIQKAHELRQVLLWTGAVMFLSVSRMSELDAD